MSDKKPLTTFGSADVLFLGMVAGGCLDLYKLDSEKVEDEYASNFPSISFDPNSDADVNTNWSKMRANADALQRLHEACCRLAEIQERLHECESRQK